MFKTTNQILYIYIYCIVNDITTVIKTNKNSRTFWENNDILSNRKTPQGCAN